MHSVHVQIFYIGCILALMAVESFKLKFSVSYGMEYLSMTETYARGIGIQSNSIFELAVQFVGRDTFICKMIEVSHL